MVFCYSDVTHDNFMMDSTGTPVVIDFALTSILPSSFAKMALKRNFSGLYILDDVWIPATEGVDNSDTLVLIAEMMVMRKYSFYKAGEAAAEIEEELNRNALATE